MKNRILYLSILATSFAFACSSPEKEKAMDNKDAVDTVDKDTALIKNDNAVKLDSVDVNFFREAAYGGMMEVESSEKILQESKYPEVIAFAKMMSKDHGDANQKLKALAQSKGYGLPKILPTKMTDQVKKMDEFKNEGKNEYYVQLMIAEHVKAIGVFSQASRSNDKDIATFASSTLPTLNHHYNNVKKLDTLLRAPKANQGDDPLKISNRKKN